MAHVTLPAEGLVAGIAAKPNKGAIRVWPSPVSCNRLAAEGDCGVFLSAEHGKFTLHSLGRKPYASVVVVSSKPFKALTMNALDDRIERAEVVELWYGSAGALVPPGAGRVRRETRFWAPQGPCLHAPLPFVVRFNIPGGLFPACAGCLPGSNRQGVLVDRPVPPPGDVGNLP